MSQVGHSSNMSMGICGTSQTPNGRLLNNQHPTSSSNKEWCAIYYAGNTYYEYFGGAQKKNINLSRSWNGDGNKVTAASMSNILILLCSALWSCVPRLRHYHPTRQTFKQWCCRLAFRTTRELEPSTSCLMAIRFMRLVYPRSIDQSSSGPLW